MAPLHSKLQTSTTAHLRKLASLIGAPTSGTKSLLRTRLLAAVTVPKLATTPARILSIDMGIRNLAYAHLELPSSHPAPPKRGKAKLQNEPAARPVLKAWERLVISSAPGAESPVVSSTPAAAADVIAIASPKAAKEVFDPATYAAHAYALVRSLVLESPHGIPDTVLIERQRFRSMGGAAVQEWTLRVNMLEAMLWAVLGTLREEGRWEGVVWGVMPGRVAGFWVEGSEAEAEAVKGVVGEGKEVEVGLEAEGKAGREGKVRRKGSGAKGKEEKIELVERWLRGGDVVHVGSAARKTVTAYLRKREGGGRAKKREVEEAKMGKLDDLADCLLQGMAWIRWEENRREIVSQGLEGLEELG